MGCGSCGSGSDGKPSGCKSNGSCSTGGCNKKNTFNWLADYDTALGGSSGETPIVEVSFKKGARKEFFLNPIHAVTGDEVAVKTDNGHDIGTISLSGDLVKLQMKKKRVKEDSKLSKILRVATESDLEKQSQAREKELKTLIRTRILARELGLNMKMGDIEYQADNRKATFYYTAEGRVDFRELIKVLAKEFKVKVEMRQIGSRQESARIGGIGACGRELCCSTWLSQNLSINQTKLSGQCGRLKCCLNYELDTYMDGLQAFPKKADYLRTGAGDASLIKTDVFKKLMYYVYRKSENNKIYTISTERVKEILAMNADGKKPEGLEAYQEISKEELASEAEADFADVTGQIELAPLKKKSRNKKRKGGNSNNRNNRNNKNRPKSNNSDKKQDKAPQGKKGPKGNNQRRKKRPQGNRPNAPQNKNKPSNSQNKSDGGKNKES